MTKVHVTLVIAVVGLSLGGAQADSHAQTIDFETLPDGTPTKDRQQISNEYSEAPFGVSFAIVNANEQVVGFPEIGKVGPPVTAFWGCPDDDTPIQSPDQGVGQSFLDDSSFGTPAPGNLLVTYSDLVAEASGVIIDADWFDQWTVTARDSNGATVDTAVLRAPTGPDQPCTTHPGAGPGDGVAARWVLQSRTHKAEIQSILIAYSGLYEAGFALDNFSPASVWQCESVTRPKLTVRKLNTPPGDDRLSLSGEVTLPYPFNPALNPLANGVRLRLEGTAGSLRVVTVPGGAFDRSTGKGWKVNRRGTKWTYRDKTATPTGGIYSVVIQDKSSKTPGLVKFTVKGKAGSYAVAPDDLPVTARLILAPPGAKCGGTSFTSCAFNGSGSTLKCK